MDCSWGEGNNACDGGEDFRAYQWIMKHGLASEEDYGPYMGIVCIYLFNTTIIAHMKPDVKDSDYLYQLSNKTQDCSSCAMSK